MTLIVVSSLLLYGCLLYVLRTMCERDWSPGNQLCPNILIPVAVRFMSQCHQHKDKKESSSAGAVRIPN